MRLEYLDLNEKNMTPAESLAFFSIREGKERRNYYVRFSMFALKLIILAASFYGPVRTAELAWAFGDAGLGIMVWLNVIAILILAKPALIALKDYETQKKAGVDPVFDPKALGIKNADFWEHEYTGDKENVS